MTPSLTDLPLLVLELIFTSTRYPQELLRSCRGFYELSKSHAIRAQWIIYNFGFHAIEAAVLDFPRLFKIQGSTFCPETLDVLLNMYGIVPHYILMKIVEECDVSVLLYIRGYSDYTTDDPDNILSGITTSYGIPQEIDNWFGSLGRKSDEESMQELEEYLGRYKLPGLWALSDEKWHLDSVNRFFKPYYFDFVTQFICSQKISARMVQFLLNKGMCAALPAHVGKRGDADEPFEMIVIHSKDGTDSDTYLNGREFAGLADDHDVYRFQRETQQMTKSLATADMDALLFALIHEKYEIAEVLRDHDVKRWETPWGKEKLRYMNVVLRALNNDKALALLPGLLDENEICRVDEKANELRVILDLLKCIIDLDVDGAIRILRVNSNLISRTEFMYELGQVCKHFLKRVNISVNTRIEVRILAGKMQRLVDKMIASLREAYDKFRWYGRFPKDQFLGADLLDGWYSDTDDDVGEGGETPPEYFREYSADEESEIGDPLGLLNSAGYLNIGSASLNHEYPGDISSDSVPPDSGDGKEMDGSGDVKEIEEDVLVFDDEVEEKDCEISSGDSSDLEGKELDYDEEHDEEAAEEEEAEEAEGSEEEEKTGAEDGVAEDWNMVESEYDGGYDSGDNFAYEYEMDEYNEDEDVDTNRRY